MSLIVNSTKVDFGDLPWIWEPKPIRLFFLFLSLSQHLSITSPTKFPGCNQAAHLWASCIYSFKFQQLNYSKSENILRFLIKLHGLLQINCNLMSKLPITPTTPDIEIMLPTEGSGRTSKFSDIAAIGATWMSDHRRATSLQPTKILIKNACKSL